MPHKLKEILSEFIIFARQPKQISLILNYQKVTQTDELFFIEQCLQRHIQCRGNILQQ